MIKKKTLFIILALSALIAYLHINALEYKLYFIYPWFDILLHFLGGVLISLIFFVIYLYYKADEEILSLSRMIIWFGLLPALLVGVSWEVFELWVGVMPAENYTFDTLIDLLMDSIGGLSGALLILNLKEKGKEESNRCYTSEV